MKSLPGINAKANGINALTSWFAVPPTEGRLREPWFNATIEYSLIAMPVSMLNTRYVVGLQCVPLVQSSKPE